MLSRQTNCSHNPRQFILNISARQEYDLLGNINHHHNHRAWPPLILTFSRQNCHVQGEEWPGVNDQVGSGDLQPWTLLATRWSTRAYQRNRGSLAEQCWFSLTYFITLGNLQTSEQSLVIDQWERGLRNRKTIFSLLFFILTYKDIWESFMIIIPKCIIYCLKFSRVWVVCV